MSRATWLAATLRAEGLTVTEHPGWDTRGSADFNPHGIVCHHTASNPPANTPALNTVTNGRPDLPGPLCNVLLARNGDCHIIASGRANHAGAGGWNGLVGNSSVLGIEAENNGIGEPWPAHQIEAFIRLCAAMCRGGNIDPDNVCYHREWAPTRKPDPAGPGIPQDGNEWRSLVRAAIDNPGGDMPLTQDDAFVIGIVVKKVFDDLGIVDRLDKLEDETKGLRARTSLTRRICRAIAHKVGVTQAEIDSQA